MYVWFRSHVLLQRMMNDPPSQSPTRAQTMVSQPQPFRAGACVHCGATASLRCARCQAIYCSRKCQEADWKGSESAEGGTPGHRRVCTGKGGSTARASLLFHAQTPHRCVFALCDLPRGSLLFVERPLVAVNGIPGAGNALNVAPFFPPGTPQYATAAERDAGGGMDGMLDRALAEKYTKEELLERFAVTDAEVDDGSALDSDGVSEEQAARLAVARRVRAANAFVMQSLSFMSYGAAFCELAASFNHACFPNACYKFGRGGRIHIFATEDISRGTEVIPYFSMHMARELCLCERHRTSLEEMGFICQCRDCAATEPCPDADHSTLDLSAEQIAALEGMQAVFAPPDAVVANLVPVWRKHRDVIGEHEGLSKLFASKFVMALERARLVGEARVVLDELAAACDKFPWSPVLFPSPAYMRLRAVRDVALPGVQEEPEREWVAQMQKALPWTEDVWQFDPFLHFWRTQPTTTRRK
jgi:MYND finger/SET domain